MTTIPLTDKFGLTADAQLAPTSALLKYAQQLTSLHFESLDVNKLQGLTLADPAVQSLTTGVAFKDPIALGDGAATLTVAAGVNGSFQLITDPAQLPGHEDTVPLAAGQCYLRFGVNASASVSPGATVGEVSFGVTPATSLTLASYSRFPQAGVSLLQALQQTIGSFAVTLSCDDLAALAPGQIAQASLSGSLTLSASANLLALANPLAAASLPAPLPAVSVAAGGSVTVAASFAAETDYDVIARKLDSGVVRLSWYKKKGSSVTVSVTAAEGVSAGTSTTDIAPLLIGAISASPEVDEQELKAAGVPAAQFAAIEAAVKAAACRKIEIAVEAAFTASSATVAVFLYDIDPAALTPTSRAAVNRALHGDLGPIHAPTLPGITCVRTVLEDIRKQEIDLNVNLIGILNYRSVTALALDGKVLYEPQTGTLLITDTATAQRVQTAQINFGADADKLRKVLAESFLITAAYHGAGQGIGMPSLRCSQAYFELQASTSAHDMAVKLRTGAALRLLAGADAAVPAGVSNFGRTLIEATADFDDALAERLFLEAASSPLSVAAFESAGRTAIQLLVQPGDQDEVRRRPAIEDPLWNTMKDKGQPGIPALFPGVPVPFVNDIVSDYTTIRWWADAMSDTAKQLAKVRLWLSRNPAPSPDDPAFKKLRADLAEYLAGVAANTHDQFGAPWGLIAMNQLAGPNAPASILITGPQVVRNKRRALVAVPVA